MSLAPFAGAAVLAWLTMLVSVSVDVPAYIGSVILLVVSGALVAAGHGTGRAARFGHLSGSLVFLLAVAVLRDSAGGSQSGVAVLSMIPVFYAALSGSSRRQLAIVLAAVAALYLVPIVVIGPPPYPHSQYRAAVLSVTVSSIIGLATRSLVARIKQQATEAGRRERMLEQVGQVVHGLFDSTDPRSDVCVAARAISDASAAMLLEPDDGGVLIATATSGLDAEPLLLPVDPDHSLYATMRSARPRLIADETALTVIDPIVWHGQDRPGSLLLQPLLKGGRVSGLLVVAWPARISVTGSRSTVVALLAHEAAAAIGRSDQLRRLAGMAQTDPLTGLPNRRAWDARLARAAREGEPFTIAMLDLDHFKRFNDTYGHPAGDRVLKQTAAAWRDQLRGGDLLARLGGEEFGLILFGCGLQAATEVTGRLRDLVTEDQTCSVGLALRRGEEPCDSVVARADQALYEAKAAGRDRARASV